MVPTSLQDEALARDGVSREVPCSALKGKTVTESLHATPQKFPDTPGSLEGNTEVPGTASYEPLLPSLSRQKSRFPSVVWKGFPDFPRTSG